MTILNKHFFNKGSLYIFLWCLYYLQGTLYNYGNMFTLLIAVGLILYNIYLAFQISSEQDTPRYFKVFSIFVIMISVYGIARLIVGEDIHYYGGILSKYNTWKQYLISLTPIYGFYYLSKRGDITFSTIKIWFFVFLVVVFFAYRNNLYYMLSLDNRTEVTNNAGYLVLSLFPYVLFFRKSEILKYGILLVLSYFVIAAMKRGAIITGVVSLFIILLYSLKSASTRKKILVIVFSVVAIWAIFLVVGDFLSTSDYFNQRLDRTLEGDASGRGDMYPMYFNQFINEPNPFVLLFGNGIDGTAEIFGDGAHNDWLELLINFGLFGAIIYLIYWIRYYQVIKSIQNNGFVKVILVMVFVAELMKTFFSFSMNNLPIYTTLLMGYCLANINQSEETIFDR